MTHWCQVIFEGACVLCTCVFTIYLVFIQAIYQKTCSLGILCIRIRDLAETIESGPLFITDLFQNKSVAYF